MLTVAEVTDIDVNALAFIAERFEHHLGMLDAAEPVRRAELERLVAQDFDELASAFKFLTQMVDRGGAA